MVSIFFYASRYLGYEFVYLRGIQMEKIVRDVAFEKKDVVTKMTMDVQGRQSPL